MVIKLSVPCSVLWTNQKVSHVLLGAFSMRCLEVIGAGPALHGRKRLRTAPWMPVCLGAGTSSSSVPSQDLASVEWENFTHELKQTHVLGRVWKLEFRLEVWLGQVGEKCQGLPSPGPVAFCSLELSFYGVWTGP